MKDVGLTVPNKKKYPREIPWNLPAPMKTPTAFGKHY